MSDSNKNNVKFEEILSSFFAAITVDSALPVESSTLLQTLVSIYKAVPFSGVCSFSMDDNSVTEAIKVLKKNLKTCSHEQIRLLNLPLSYLLDEFICNIQQHAQTDTGYAYLNHNVKQNTIEIVIADFGITIYGSYVIRQKYLDKLGDSDADALSLAQNGYSVKNLPDAENRGYGISSNMRMVVNGLGGEFAMLSGNALLLYSRGEKKILSLPSEIDFKGTMIIVRVPDTIPNDFNLYSYTS